ncbi:MAG: HD domain-containing protein [Lentisphaerae bacterium]|nr:HD domain-containing protein [Lentisphaerota bacterium]
MQYLRAVLVRRLVAFFGQDDRRIDHALRVLGQADRLMDRYQGCDEAVVIASALLHDVGIRISEEKHGCNDGRTQELYGPPAAEEILEAVGFPADKTAKVKEIVGNHHSPSRYDYPELALLKEADRIVNRSEERDG